MKKLLVFLLALSLALSLSAPLAMAEENLTIEFWHAGTGSVGTTIDDAIAEFNATIGAEKGITVVGTYQGSYDETLAKTMNALAAGNYPALVQLECATGVSSLYDSDALVVLDDLMASSETLTEEDFVDILMYHSKRDDQLIAIPYMPSCAVYYYNKTLFDELGLSAPKTMEDLEAVGKAIHEAKPDVYGFEMYCMSGGQWVFTNMITQMGSNLFSEDGQSCPSLEDGTMLKVFQDWRRWVDEGWCSVPAITNTGSVLRENFAQGRVASFIYSCGSMTGILDAVANSDAPFEVGVAYVPTYGIECCPIGGNEIGILNANSDEVVEAAWEFVEFLCTPEQAAITSKNTGYVPALKSAIETDVIKDLWAEYPTFEVAFDQLMDCQAVQYNSQYFTDMMEPLNEACSLLIQDQSITPEEALQLMIDEASIILP